jgi:alkyl sulfatase BDS1-like metallo-beta-lactamase superfamily hydrolase
MRGDTLKAAAELAEEKPKEEPKQATPREMISVLNRKVRRHFDRLARNMSDEKAFDAVMKKHFPVGKQ